MKFGYNSLIIAQMSGERLVCRWVSTRYPLPATRSKRSLVLWIMTLL